MDLNTEPLLGLKSCVEMKLINIDVEDINSLDHDKKSLTIEQIQNLYESVFKGLGNLEGEYKIEIQENRLDDVQDSYFKNKFYFEFVLLV